MQTDATQKRPTNLALDTALLTEAKALGVNLSRAAEEGVRSAVASAKANAWRRENAAAIQDANQYVDSNGVPLERHRQF